MGEARPWRIAIIEDRMGVLFLIEEALSIQQITFESQHYHDVEDAMGRLFRESTPIPDVVLLEASLCRKDGLEVLRAIRRSDRLRDVPVAVLSSSPAKAKAIAAFQAGADRYIRKPRLLPEFLSGLGRPICELLAKRAA